MLDAPLLVDVVFALRLLLHSPLAFTFKLNFFVNSSHKFLHATETPAAWQ